MNTRSLFESEPPETYMVFARSLISGVGSVSSPAVAAAAARAAIPLADALPRPPTPVAVFAVATLAVAPIDGEAESASLEPFFSSGSVKSGGGVGRDGITGVSACAAAGAAAGAGAGG